MQETNSIRAIVLRRVKYRENDSKISVYSFEKGLLELVVRGTARSKSKLAGHIEPFNLVNIMIVKGKNFDYAGSVVSEKSFLNIKNDIEKIDKVGEAFRFFLNYVRGGEADKNLFLLLLDLLLLLDSKLIGESRLDYIIQIFKLKLFYFLGYTPELIFCVNCKQKIIENKIFFDMRGGGVLCPDCYNNNDLLVSSNLVKILRLCKDKNLNSFIRLEKNLKLEKEIKKFTCFFCGYNS